MSEPEHQCCDRVALPARRDSNKTIEPRASSRRSGALFIALHSRSAHLAELAFQGAFASDAVFKLWFDFRPARVVGIRTRPIRYRSRGPGAWALVPKVLNGGSMLPPCAVERKG